MPKFALPSETFGASSTPAPVSWEPLPVGEYAYQVESATSETNEKSGLLKLRVILYCKTDYQYTQVSGRVVNSLNRQVWHFFDLQPKSMWAIEAFMDAAGIPYRKELNPQTGKPVTYFDSDEMPGHWVYGYTEVHEWNGKRNNRIAKWSPYIGDEAPPF
jgi:hypothetical protein